MTARLYTGLVTASASVNAKPIACPRCGYDQRGAMATWTESCPLEHTCTECGLQFEWRELFDPRLVLPRWCVESRRSIWTLPIQFIRTTLRCWVSSILWRDVQMFHPVNWHRLQWWIVSWCALAVLTILLSNGLFALGQWQQYVSATGLRGGGTWTASTGGWPVFLQATLMPLSNHSLGTYSFPGVAPTNPYVPPRVFLQSLLRRLGVPLILLLAIPIASGLTFAALPISRRRAKTRWEHIARAAAYSIGITYTLALALLINNALTIWIDLPDGPAAVAAGASTKLAILRLVTGVGWLVIWFVVLALLPAFVGFWWSCARRYLRMDHAFAVGLSVAIIGMLAPVSIYGLLWYLLG